MFELVAADTDIQCSTIGRSPFHVENLAFVDVFIWCRRGEVEVEEITVNQQSVNSRRSTMDVQRRAFNSRGRELRVDSQTEINKTRSSHVSVTCAVLALFIFP